MRTTLDIDDDVLAAAKELGASEGVTVGQIISRLARRGLQTTAVARGGVPLLPSRGEVITYEHVQSLQDQEGI
jgi:hypothetical protein